MIDILQKADKAAVLKKLRTRAQTIDVTEEVKWIVERVAAEGDRALFDLAARFDRAQLDSLLVSQQEIDQACAAVGQDVLDLLRRCMDKIAAFHKLQTPRGFCKTDEEGIVLGQRVTPIDKVGIYVPGGTAAYPSTVLMTAVPARIAGVRRIVMVTPPRADGTVNPIILAAASVAGVDCIYKSGGAQAIAALAFGTDSIERVDKIVGPGNMYV